MLIRVALLTTLGLIFSGCAKPALPFTPSQLHGRWTYSAGAKLTLTFNSDGTYNLQVTGKPEKPEQSVAGVMTRDLTLSSLSDAGTWYMTGRNKLYIRGKGKGVTFQRIRVEDRTLTCVIEESVATFTKTD